MQKRILLLLAGLVWMQTTYAQPNYYILEQKSATYTELSNDTTIPGAFATSGSVWMLQLVGEKFSFFDKVHTINNVKSHIVFSNNGFIRVEDDSTFIVADAAFNDVDSIDATTRLSYIVEGTSGNHIIKVQWKNLKITNGPAGNFLNYQIWLYQKTGVFEIYYGPSSTNNQSGYSITSGPYIGLFYSLTSFSKMFEKIWLKGLPGSYTIDSAKNINFPSVEGLPPGGNMMRFVPRKVANSISETGKIISGVYPNPATEEITVQLKSAGNTTNILLTDMQGKVVLNQSYTAGKQALHIPVAQVAPGLYEVVVESNGIKETQTITIQH